MYFTITISVYYIIHIFKEFIKYNLLVITHREYLEKLMREHEWF